jgi:hypothetical protein
MRYKGRVSSVAGTAESEQHRSRLKIFFTWCVFEGSTEDMPVGQEMQDPRQNGLDGLSMRMSAGGR